MNARRVLTIGYLVCGLLGGAVGCGAVSEADRALARELMAQSGSNCIHIEGGTAMAMIPMAGGVTGGGWRGAISAAHSESDKALYCGPLSASTGGAASPEATAKP